MNLNDHNPVSLQDAIRFITENLDAEDRHYILVNGAESCHFTAGMAIRNAWIHPEGSVLAKHFLDNFGPLHADDMSDLILHGVTCMVRKEPFDAQPHVQRYRDHWAKHGIDPVTGHRIK